MAAVPAAAFVPTEALTKFGHPRRPPPLRKPLTDDERGELAAIERELDAAGVDRRRPRTLAECPPPGEPCPFVSCRYHLYLEVLPRTGAVKFRFPGLEVDELPATCSLQVAADGEHDPVTTAKLLNVSRAMVHLDEVRALKKMRPALDVERTARRVGHR